MRYANRFAGEPSPTRAALPARAAVALAVSVFVHLALLSGIAPQTRDARMDAPVPVLTARLIAVPDVATEPVISPGLPPNGSRAVEPTQAAPLPAPAAAKRVVPATPRAAVAELPVVDDPVYYGASDLDVFLRLAQAAPSHPADSAPPRHKAPVRLELLIDAAGQVRGVSVLTSSGAAELLRAAWREARFEPARKGAQAVASRIEIEVRYEPDDLEEAAGRVSGAPG